MKQDNFGIINKFFPELIDKTEYKRTTEREDQYGTLFSTEEMSKFYETYSNDNAGIDKLGTEYISHLLHDLLSSNEIFNTIKEKVTVSFIKTDNNSSCSFSYGNQHIVLFDVNAMTFIWMLDKAYLYGAKLDLKSQIILYIEIILYFISTSYGLNVKKPKTPPHADRISLANLATIIEVQELFMLAHEMAHVIQDKETAIKKNTDFIKKFSSLIGYNLETEDISSLSLELEADRIAFISVLNVFRGKDTEKNVFVFITSAIFLLIRYNLWINIAGHDLLQHDTFNIWFIRNEFFRRLIDEKYEWGAPTYIIDMLDTLEDTFEQAALIASEIIKEKSVDLENLKHK